MGIHIGDVIDVEIDVSKNKLSLKKPKTLKSDALAGCFSKFKEINTVPFPSRRQMHEALAEGLTNEE